MVVIQCKRMPRDEHSRDYDEFFFSTPNTTNVGEATDAVQRIQNLRVRAKWMSLAIRELLKDPRVAADNVATLQGVATETDRYLSLDRIAEKHLSTVEQLLEMCENMKGAVMMAFPESCSGTDAQQRLVSVLDSDTASEQERAFSHRVLSVIDDDAKTEDILDGPAVMWWCNKPLDRTAELSKHSGRNDKTKLVVKLTLENGQAPPRESGLDRQTQAEMMQYWHRKQEETKKLIDDDDISFGNSEWANPRGLKDQLHGMGGVSFKPR